MANITKEQILALVRSGISDGTLSKDDILNTVGFTSNASTDLNMPQNKVSENSLQTHKTSTIEMLQYIGGFIVLLGIGTFIATFWDDIDSGTRVLISVGAAILSYVLGTILLKTDQKTQSGVAFHLIAGVIFPFSFYVVLQELFMMNITAGVTATISFFLLLIYAMSFFVFRHIIFTFFMLAYSISFLYSSVYALIPDISIELISYITLVIGAIGIFIGRSFKDTENEPLSELMYFLGSAAILISPAFLFDSTPVWEVVYPFLLASMFYLALLFHSKRILTTSVLALMGYVVYLTIEYFSDVVGWPVALIFSGIALIAIGYVSIKFKSKI